MIVSPKKRQEIIKKTKDILPKIPNFEKKLYPLSEKEGYSDYCFAIDEISKYLEIKQHIGILMIDIEEHLENLEYTLKWAYDQIYISRYSKYAIIRAYAWDNQIKAETNTLKRRYSMFSSIMKEKTIINNLHLIWCYEQEYSDFKDPNKEDYIEIYTHITEKFQRF